MSSSLIVEVCEIKNINEHPEADALEIAIVKGWECVVKKGQYKIGDIIIYIPIDAILPEDLADRFNVRNYLRGKEKNRVGCIKLRGQMSYGLLINNEENWDLGTDVAEHYGITKYCPPVRPISGDADKNDPLFEKFTDIENIKNFPEMFVEGEQIIVTEKIDGSNVRIALTVSLDSDGNFIVEKKAGSHGLKRKNPSLIKNSDIDSPVDPSELSKVKDEDIINNTYWFPWSLTSIKSLMSDMEKMLKKDIINNNKSFSSVILYGEIYGKIRGGHKSLHYGVPDTLNFIAFAFKKDGKYYDWKKFNEICNDYGIPRVPLVFMGEYKWEEVSKLASGDSLLAKVNNTTHMREGVVVLPIVERESFRIGRAVAKFINPDYLLLKQKKSDAGEETDFTDV